MNERVTVEVDAETLARAREAGIDLSKTFVRALRRELPPLSDEQRKQAAEQFYRENKEAIDASSEFIAKHGLLSDGLRMKAPVNAELEAQWLIDNRAAIEAYNRRVAEHGLLSDSAGLL